MKMPPVTQHALQRLIVELQISFKTVVVKFNQGLCRNKGVICFGLTFWFFCVKTKERIAVAHSIYPGNLFAFTQVRARHVTHNL